MKFTLESARGIQIHACQPGEVILRLPTEDSAKPHQLVSYRSSLILTNTDRVENWGVSHVSEVESQHFQLAWQDRPEIVLFGSGQRLIFPAHDIRQRFSMEGIGFEAMDTPAACRTYNVLIAEGRDVMALLIID